MTHKQIMNGWWNCVKKCLVKFHKINARSAAQKTRRRREYYAKHNLGKKFDILYHEEPFREAEFITGKQINLTQQEYISQYLEGIDD